MKKSVTVPTFLALAVLIAGIALGVILIDKNQTFQTRAQLSQRPKNVNVSNITDSSLSVSWTTDKETVGFIKIGTNPLSLSQPFFEERQTPGFTHHVNIDGLNPNTTYFFVIVSGGREYKKDGSNPWVFQTGLNIPNQPASNVIFGSVRSQQGEPVLGALVYAATENSNPISTMTDENGDWLLVISTLRDRSLSNYLGINNNQTILNIHIQAGPLGFAQVSTVAANAKPLPTTTLNTSKKLIELIDTNKENTPEAALVVPTNSTSSSGFRN